MHYGSISRNRRRNEWGMRVHDDLGRERCVCGGARDRFSDRSSTHATCTQNRSSTHMGLPQIRPHFAWSLPVRVSQEYARRRRRGDSSSVLEVVEGVVPVGEFEEDIVDREEDRKSTRLNSSHVSI